MVHISYLKCERKRLLLTFFLQTSCKGITSEARVTTTYWVVIHNLTASTDATSARTRVHTLLDDTCFVLRAFCAHNTFRFATWRCSYIISLTWANCMTIHHTALAEWPTWRRLAGIHNRLFCWSWRHAKKMVHAWKTTHIMKRKDNSK